MHESQTKVNKKGYNMEIYVLHELDCSNYN